MGRKTDPEKRDAHAALYGIAAAALAVCLGVFLAEGLEDRERRSRTTVERALGGEDGGSPIVLAWSVAHEHWGTEALLVRGDGRARYLLDPPSGGGPPIRAELTLPAADVAELRRRVSDAHPCELSSKRRAGRPHESRPTLEVALPDAHCTVTLWFDEWREDAGARATAAIVSELRDSLRHAGGQ